MYIVTVSYGQVCGAAKGYPYWQPALYEARLLKNGRFVWYYAGHLGKARRSHRLAESDAKRIAEKNGYAFALGIRHLQTAPNLDTEIDWRPTDTTPEDYYV